MHGKDVRFNGGVGGLGRLERNGAIEAELESACRPDAKGKCGSNREIFVDDPAPLGS